MEKTQKLLITDMDHTLLDGDSRVSPENLAAIARHVASGGLFSVASGRAPAAIRIFPELLPYINVPVIMGNGGMICELDTGKVLFQKVLPPETAELVTQLLETFPELGAVTYSGYDGFYSFRSNPEIEELVSRERRPVTASSIQSAPRPWSKVLTAAPHSRLKEVKAWVDPRLEGLARSVYSEPIFLELLPLGVSKGDALTVLLDLLGLEPGQVVAAGDGLNDLEMIRTAGCGVAVANAEPELKAAADHLVCSNREHAIRECVERFC